MFHLCINFSGQSSLSNLLVQFVLTTEYFYKVLTILNSCGWFSSSGWTNGNNNFASSEVESFKWLFGLNETLSLWNLWRPYSLMNIIFYCCGGVDYLTYRDTSLLEFCRHSHSVICAWWQCIFVCWLVEILWTGLPLGILSPHSQCVWYLAVISVCVSFFFRFQ